MSVALRDTAGQERYASLAPLYYRGASAACVAYDITNAESFQKAKHWVSELQKNASGAIGERCLHNCGLRSAASAQCAPHLRERSQHCKTISASFKGITSTLAKDDQDGCLHICLSKPAFKIVIMWCP